EPQARVARQVLALARRQVVEHGHLVPLLEEQAHEVRADEAGAAGDEYPHAHTSHSGPSSGATKRWPRARPCTAAISSAVSSKSKTSRLAARRAGSADLGTVATRGCCTSQRKATCSGDLPYFSPSARSSGSSPSSPLASGR